MSLSWSKDLIFLNKNFGINLKNLGLFSSITLVIFSTTTIHAQTGNSTEARGGSVYSALGVGFPVDNTSSGLLSQGILGVTNVNRETSSLANPGLWAENFYTQAGTGIQLTRSNVESISGNGTNVNLQTGYIHLLLPIKPGKIGLSVGLSVGLISPLGLSPFQHQQTTS